MPITVTLCTHILILLMFMYHWISHDIILGLSFCINFVCMWIILWDSIRSREPTLFNYTAQMIPPSWNSKKHCMILVRMSNNMQLCVRRLIWIWNCSWKAKKVTKKLCLYGMLSVNPSAVILFVKHCSRASTE